MPGRHSPGNRRWTRPPSWVGSRVHRIVDSSFGCHRRSPKIALRLVARRRRHIRTGQPKFSTGFDDVGCDQHSGQHGEFGVVDLGHFTDDNTEPGWYTDPDQSNAGGQRHWDGGQWTQHSAPGTPRPTRQPTPGQPASQGGGNRGLKIVLAIAAVLILAVGFGSIFGSDEGNGEPDPASATSSDLLTATTTTRTGCGPLDRAAHTGAPAPTTAEATPAAGCLDVPGDVLSALNASLEPSGYELGSPAAYDDGDTLYIAGEIVELQDGGIRSRDDVVAQQGPILTPVTVTARNEYTLLDRHDQLELEFSDPASLLHLPDASPAHSGASFPSRRNARTVILTTIDRAALTLTSLPSDPAQSHEMWSTLSPADKDALFAHGNYIGNRDGLPVIDRDHYNRIKLDDELSRAEACGLTVSDRLVDLQAVRRERSQPDADAQCAHKPTRQ